MSYNKIKNYFYSKRVRIFDKRRKIVEITEFFIDRIIIGYIVTAVFKRTFKYGIEPYNVCAKVFDIIKFFGYSRKIANAVTVFIVKTRGINFVNNTFFRSIISLYNALYIIRNATDTYVFRITIS